jgi:hypothetical protein
VFHLVQAVIQRMNVVLRRRARVDECHRVHAPKPKRFIKQKTNQFGDGEYGFSSIPAPMLPSCQYMTRADAKTTNPEEVAVRAEPTWLRHLVDYRFISVRNEDLMNKAGRRK